MTSSFTFQGFLNKGLLQVKGPDSLSFLQGQLTCDLRKLLSKKEAISSKDASHVLTTQCDPQGKVKTILRVIALNPLEEGFLLVFPAKEAVSLHKRLERFSLGRHIYIFNRMAEWDVYGYYGKWQEENSPAYVVHLPACGDAPERSEIYVPKDHANGVALVNSLDQEWARWDTMSGIPHLPIELAGKILAPYLGPHLLKGIDHEKGCYLGQEVLARLHYRGQAKYALFKLTFETAFVCQKASISVYQPELGFCSGFILSEPYLVEGMWQCLTVLPLGIINKKNLFLHLEREESPLEVKSVFLFDNHFLDII